MSDFFEAAFFLKPNFTESNAAAESVLANCCHTVRNFKLDQSASRKASFSDVFNITRNFDVFEIITVLKGLCLDSRQRGRERYPLYCAMSENSSIKFFSSDNFFGTKLFQTFVQFYAFQLFAIIKCSGTNFFNARRENNALETSLSKAFYSDRLEPFV